MPFPYTRTATAFSYGRPVISSVCLPYQVTTFPWEAYFFDTSLPGTLNYYNNPTDNGVTLNLNLGGYSNSWTGPNVYISLIDKNASTLYVAGGEVWNQATYAMGTDIIIDLWRYSSTFTITDSTVKSRYLLVGGNPDGSGNPAPGYHQYPGVATYSPTPGSRVVQMRNFGQPIIFELWYSLNQSRNNPLVGYGNYTFFGDQSNVMPYFDLSQPGAYVKKYQGGILHVNANMNNLTDSDFIAGVSYVGNASSGLVKIILNGIVVQTLNTTKTVVKVQSSVDTICEGTTTQIGNAKSNVSYWDISVTYSDSTSEFISIGNYYLPATDGLIDTYLCKWAWIVDSYTGGVEDNNVYCNPPMMYTPPNVNLLCAPVTSVPNYTPSPPIV